MATVAVTFQSVCAGGCHVFVNALVDGSLSFDLRLNADEIRVPVTAQEAPQLLTDLLRIKFRGLTRAQARTQLQAGFTITI